METNSINDLFVPNKEEFMFYKFPFIFEKI